MTTVFSRAWFAGHQRSLRAALNVPGLERELRAALGITARGRLVQLEPHAAVIDQRDGRAVAEVWSRPCVATRLRHEGLALWHLLHWFDRHVANPWVPAFNLGFDTLTQFPDPGDPGAHTCDGHVGLTYQDLPFSALRDGAGNAHNAAGSGYLAWQLTPSATPNQWKHLFRSIMGFDLTALGIGVASAATFSVWFQDGDLHPMHVCAASPANPTTLADSDFQQVGRTSFGTISTWNTSNYTNIPLNASGLAYLGGGIRCFSLQLEADLLNAPPPWDAALFWREEVYASEYTGLVAGPKLTLTYVPIPPWVYGDLVELRNVQATAAQLVNVQAQGA